MINKYKVGVDTSIMPTRFLGDTNPIAMKILNFLLPAFSFMLTTYGLEIDWQYVALAVGSSVAGSLLLGFYRPERTLGRMVYKMLLSAVAGLIFGSAAVAWWKFETFAYVGVAYCVSALMALFFLKSLVGFGQANSDSLTRTVLQRIFNVPIPPAKDCPDGEKTVRRKKDRGVHVAHSDGKPVVVIDAGAKPDEVRVIEQTVVDTQKEGENK